MSSSIFVLSLLLILCNSTCIYHSFGSLEILPLKENRTSLTYYYQGRKQNHGFGLSTQAKNTSLMFFLCSVAQELSFYNFNLKSNFTYGNKDSVIHKVDNTISIEVQIKNTDLAESKYLFFGSNFTEISNYIPLGKGKQRFSKLSK